jgi:hypothetical protein
MNALRTLLPASFVVLAFASGASAQAPPAGGPQKPERVQVSLGFPVGVPVGDFGRNVANAGGVSAQLDASLGRSIVSVGGEVSCLWYGTESRDVDLGPAIPELAGTVVSVTTDNAMLFFHGRVRVQPHRGRWRPYADGLFGFDYIYTETSIDGTDCGSSCSSSIQATNMDDFVPSFGAGAGVMIGLGKADNPPWRLDISVRYLWGGEARYLIDGAVQRASNVSLLDVRRSRTDLVAMYVGISFGR